MRVNIVVYPEKNWLYVYEEVTKKTGPASSETTPRKIIDTRSEDFKQMHGRAQMLQGQKMGVYAQRWDIDDGELEEAILYTIFKDPEELT